MTVVDYGPDVATLRRRLEEAEAEIARLRARVERLRAWAWAADDVASANSPAARKAAEPAWEAAWNALELDDAEDDPSDIELVLDAIERAEGASR